MALLEKIQALFGGSPVTVATVDNGPQPLDSLSIAGMREGLWHWDSATHQFRVSKGWAASLGWQPSDVGDRLKDWYSLIHPYYAGVVRRDLAAFIKGTSEQFECEYRIRHRDGSYRWVLCRAQAVRDQQGVATEISGVQTDVTHLIETRNGLIDEAIHDRLTGLPNRGYFTVRLEQAIEDERRDPLRGFAILFLDLDRFKGVNDTLGHLVGDKLLMATATRIRDSVRPCDFVARFGGDEFVILLDRTRSPLRANIAETLLVP